MSDRSIKRFAALRATLEGQLAEGEKLGAVIREQLARVDLMSERPS
jgi:type I restriction enzyme M protein